MRRRAHLSGSTTPVHPVSLRYDCSNDRALYPCSESRTPVPVGPLADASAGFLVGGYSEGLPPSPSFSRQAENKKHEPVTVDLDPHNLLAWTSPRCPGVSTEAHVVRWGLPFGSRPGNRTPRSHASCSWLPVRGKFEVHVPIPAAAPLVPGCSRLSRASLTSYRTHSLRRGGQWRATLYKHHHVLAGYPATPELHSVWQVPGRVARPHRTQVSQPPREGQPTARLLAEVCGALTTPAVLG